MEAGLGAEREVHRAAPGARVLASAHVVAAMLISAKINGHSSDLGQKPVPEGHSSDPGQKKPSWGS